MQKNNLAVMLLLMVLWAAAAAGCTGRLLAPPDPPAAIQNEHLAVVTVTAQDTLESLAQAYLGDRDAAWRIAEYNGIQGAEPGQRLVIPLKPTAYGGLRTDGYQMVPILCYPKIELKNKALQGLSIEAFEEQVHFLRENGYTTVALDRLAAFLNLSDQLPPKALVITFDSAERWVFDIAYPILKRNGFTAAVFVPTSQIGKAKRMTWKELAAMAADGFDVGSAGVTARRLTGSTPKTGAEEYIRNVEEEIGQSQKAINENLKGACRYFAYPGGETNDLVVALLKKYGYRAAFTLQGGGNPFFLHNFKVRRTVISGQDEAARFRQYILTFCAAELQ
jgi:peptidoglycan/xylan/chitin deacetylase (PgdA/CDA1 family)